MAAAAVLRMSSACVSRTFCDYLGGTSWPVRTIEDAQRFAELWAETPHGRGQWKADVLIWDLHESDERDRGQIFTILKAALVSHLLAYQDALRSSSTRR